MQDLNQVIDETAKVTPEGEQKVENQEQKAAEENVEMSLWDEVAQHTGFKPENLELDDTSVSVAEYAKALAEYQLNIERQREAEEFPEIVRLKEHLSQGGDFNSFIEILKQPDFSEIDVQEADVPTLKAIIAEEMKQRGASQIKIDLLIKSAEKEGNLLDLAQESQDVLKQLKQERMEQEEKNAQIKHNEFKKIVDETTNYLSEIINKGELGSLVIPLEDRVEFFKHVEENLYFDENQGVFYVQTPLTSKELDRELATEYYRFKRGDLSKIIQKAAETQNVKRFKSALQSERATVNGSETQGSHKKKSIFETF